VNFGSPFGFINPGNRSNFNRVYVYGVDFSGQIGGIGINASGTKSDTALNGDTVTDNGNGQWDVNLAYAFGNFNLLGGYREIGTLYGAPGYWGRIGSWTNPTDIKGPYFNLGYRLSRGLSLEGGAQFYNGFDEEVTNGLGGLGEDDEITNFKAGLKYGLTSASNVDFGVEYTRTMFVVRTSTVAVKQKKSSTTSATATRSTRIPRSSCSTRSLTTQTTTPDSTGSTATVGLPPRNSPSSSKPQRLG
jgi:hypothetical protein